MANFVDNSVTEVGSSLAAERMTRSRARQNREERAARCEANTLARRNARGRQSQGERTAARGRQSEGENRHPRCRHPGEEDRSSQPEPGRESRHPRCEHPGDEDCSSQTDSTTGLHTRMESSTCSQPAKSRCHQPWT